MRKYRLVAKIREESDSEVIKAQNIRTGTFHAIKCMKRTYNSADEVNGLKEIQALKRLSPHPNIIKLDEVLFDPPSGRLALVFELFELQHDNLYELVKDRRQHFGEATVRSYMRQIITALNHMHGKGVLHRHIKPENILINKRANHLKLADFRSAARIRGSKPPLTEYNNSITAGGIQPILWYHPPECFFESKKYGPEMDIWGAGCILFEVCTLYPLFPGSDTPDQLHRIRQVLGTPNENTKAGIISKLRRHTSRQAKFSFPRQEGIGLSVLLSDDSHTHTSDYCLDLLEQTLAYDATKRITSKKAMKHPYFGSQLKIGPPSASQDTSNQSRGTLLIEMLPDTLLGCIVSYLPKPSRALLAVSLSVSDCNWNNELWDTLDFSDVGRDLASKLKDDDISRVLQCIDAAKNLKILKLTGCVSIVGHGLSILQGSVVLRQIDLSLVGQHESPLLEPMPLILQPRVTRILESIVDTPGNELVHIQLPKNWRVKKDQLLGNFLTKYNNVLSNRHIRCSRCNIVKDNWTKSFAKGGHDYDYGLQKFACYQCLNHFCVLCSDENTPHFCDTCEKMFCMDCAPTKYCTCCEETKCSECATSPIAHCDECDQDMCEDCVPIKTCSVCDRTQCTECLPHNTCEGEGCSASNCMECADMYNVQWCEDCERYFCADCRLKEYRNDRASCCRGCTALLYPKLEIEHESLRQRLEEVLNQHPA